jgi:addiction module RelE/StbE family toxin
MSEPNTESNKYTSKTQTEIEIVIIDHCQKELRKLIRKDNMVKKRTERQIDELKQNPYIGQKLHANFDGCRAIHYYDNKYRIIYKIIEEPYLKIIILSVGHRRGVYNGLARFLKAGF